MFTIALKIADLNVQFYNKDLLSHTFRVWIIIVSSQYF